MQVYGLTHKGYIRDSNQDRYLIRKISESSFLLAIADGMGGQAGGEVAARIVIEAAADLAARTAAPDRQALHEMIMRADAQIDKETAGHPELSGMGTTATLAWFDRLTVYWSHVGDSRLYHFRNGGLIQITRDHNLAGAMTALGEFSPEQARKSALRNILEQCVGCRVCNPDSGSFQTAKKDLLLLCSDGLSGTVSHELISSRMSSAAVVRDKAEQLVNDALLAGGPDNITVIVAEVD